MHECQRRVQGRHRLQTSDAVAVGSVQLGPEALTLAAIRNKQMGLSLGHTRQVLSYGFGLEVSRGGLCRALARMARRAEPTYAGLVEAARQSPVNGMDETGWKVRAPAMAACGGERAGDGVCTPFCRDADTRRR